MKHILTAAAVVAVLFGTLGAQPAHATYCHYVAKNPISGEAINSIYGYANGISKKRVCKRAERRCVRKLRKAWGKGQANGYGCKREDLW